MALLKGQTLFPHHRQCMACRRPAMSGRRVCVGHMGARSPQAATPGRVASRTLGKLERAGMLPPELIALPVWRDLDNAVTDVRSPLRLALVLGWDSRLSQPLAWARVWRQACQVARDTPKRKAPRAFYMANL